MNYFQKVLKLPTNDTVSQDLLELEGTVMPSLNLIYDRTQELINYLPEEIEPQGAMLLDCIQNRPPVRFTYDITEINEEGYGTIHKTKIYYHDLNCEVYNRTQRAPVNYALGNPSAEGIYPINISSRTTTFYDIVHLSDDKNTRFWRHTWT